MIGTIRQWLEGIGAAKDRTALEAILAPLGDRFGSQSHTSAGLAIKTGGSALAKTGATAWAGMANNIPVTIAAATDMPALVGSITAASFNVFCFFIDQAAVVTVAMGTEATTYAGVVFPPFPAGKALIGYLIVTHSSTFVGGTTALDTATTIYVNAVGAMDPSVFDA